MKNAWLYTLGLMLLAIVAFGASLAEAGIEVLLRDAVLGPKASV
jgi:hypothetical protein